MKGKQKKEAVEMPFRVLTDSEIDLPRDPTHRERSYWRKGIRGRELERNNQKPIHRLTNKDIAANYSKESFYLMMDDFRCSFAYAVVLLQAEPNYKMLKKGLKTITKLMRENTFPDREKSVVQMSYSGIIVYIDFILFEEDALDGFDGSDSSLASTMLFHLLRNKITQPLD
jgi:hypothetical protein